MTVTGGVGPATVDPLEEPSTAGSVVRFLLGAAVSVAVVPVLNDVASHGTNSAREFATVGGDVGLAATLGVRFAAGLFVAFAVAAVLSNLRLVDRRFVVPGWALAAAIMLVLGWLGVVGFLTGIGGMGGPIDDPDPGREYGRALYAGYPAAIAWAFCAVLLLAGALRGCPIPAARTAGRWVTAAVVVAAPIAVLNLTDTASSIGR